MRGISCSPDRQFVNPFVLSKQTSQNIGSQNGGNSHTKPLLGRDLTRSREAPLLGRGIVH
jgi:hypothetical protein